LKKDNWKIIELLNTTAEYLKSKGVDAPRTSTELLLAHILGMKRLDLYLNFDKPVLEKELVKFRKIVKRRLKREPVQYIIGNIEFMSLPFEVNENVLIPRQETELLVEQIIEDFKEIDEDEIYILEVGTGCGNIAVSLAKYLEKAKIIATDISDEILNVAKKNAENNGVSEKIKFKKESIFDTDYNSYKYLDIVVSNPPYVPEKEYKNLTPEIKNYEQYEAVCDGKDGLTFFKIIAKLSMSWLKDEGELYFEIGYNQGDSIYKILENEGFKRIHIYKDYANLDRIAYAVK